MLFITEDSPVDRLQSWVSSAESTFVVFEVKLPLIMPHA